MRHALDVATSIGTTLLRLGHGGRVGAPGERPAEPIVLYEFEGCPFCRKVREALSVLDLDADIRPCPKRGPRFREDVKRQGGKYQFPYLLDPNTGKAMYESDDIVRYLFAAYGDGRVPPALWAGPLTDLSVSLAGVLRPGFGSFYRRSKPPAQPLELWSFEASPFCRIVRETLATLELPYRLHNLALGSPKRRELQERAGKVQVPYLADPNTGIEMFESADITAYLNATYAAPA